MPVQDPLMPPPPKRQGVLTFGHASRQEGPDLSSLTNDINAMGRRLKLLEESFTNLRRFFQVTEENMISKHKYYAAEIKTVTSDINEIRKEIQELKDKLLLVIKELQSVARKEEIKVLEKYINLWNPIKFVTQNEVEEIVDEILVKRQR